MNAINYRVIAAVAALAAAAGVAGPARAADPPPLPLDQALRKAAPGILKEMHARKGVTNVAVLKFLAARGDGEARDDLGAINRSLADRLEVALVLAQPDDDDLHVLMHASDAIAAAPKGTRARLTHLTPEGRENFFNSGLEFEPSWGDGKVAADAFLTGTARLSPDLKIMTVTVQLFDREHAKDDLKEVGKFTAFADARTLAESGVSFARRRGSDDDPDDARPAADTIVASNLPVYPRPDAKPDEQKKDWDQVLNDSPVRLRVYYAKDREHPKEDELATIRDGAVPTPEPGQHVVFRLKNTDAKYTYGVVLRVNGENTIEREQLASSRDSYKWVLDPGDEITVAGFQKGDKQAEEFSVAPVETSKQNAVRYGESAGTISMIVYRAAVKDDAKDDVLVRKDDDRDVALKSLTRGNLAVTAARPGDLKALKGELEKDSKALADPKNTTRNCRGLLEPGVLIGSEVQKVPFQSLPEPATAVVVRYFKP
jgi:hypothetical protein